MGAAYLAHPQVLLFGLALVVAISAAQYVQPGRQPISPKRLAWGYLAALFACAIVAALDSYVSKDEALSKWKVAEPDYWSALFNSFLVEFLLLSLVALLGIAAIGLPIIRVLHKRAMASVPWVLLSSVLISAVVATMMSAGDFTPFMHLSYWLRFAIWTHLLISVAFCVGARLPWRVRTIA